MSREVRFSSRTADLNLEIEQDGFIVSNSTEYSGYGYMWGGCHADHGVLGGNGGFEVKIVEHQKFDDADAIHEGEDLTHISRIGWTVQSSLKDRHFLSLGEHMNSFGFCSSGSKVEKGTSTPYGASFKVGDIIGCWISKDSTNVTIKFTINGEDQGIAWSLKMEESLCFIPHLFIKNTKVEVNFGQQQYPWHAPLGNHHLMNEGDVNCRLIPNPRVQVNKLTAFVGLPGAGKTTWLSKLLPELTENRAKPAILGTDSVLEQMKLIGKGKMRPDDFEKWTPIANETIANLLKKAIRIKRDTIVDQPNILPADRRKKFAEFRKAGYHCEAMCVVPDEMERINRAEKRVAATGKQIPEEMLKKMKANFIIPTETDDIFNNVRHLELAEKPAQELVDKYNEDFKSFLVPTPVVDLTENDRRSSERRITPPRRSKDHSRDRSRDHSRDRRSDRRRDRRSRTPPRNRRRSRSPPPRRDQRGRNRRSPSPPPRRGDRRSGGSWNKRDEPAWNNDDRYGFNKSQPRNDDLAQYGFSSSGSQSRSPMDTSQYDTQEWPGFNGRAPHGLERVTRINVEALKGLEVYLHSKGQGPPPRRSPQRNNHHQHDDRYGYKQDRGHDDRFNRQQSPPRNDYQRHNDRYPDRGNERFSDRGSHSGSQHRSQEQPRDYRSSPPMRQVPPQQPPREIPREPPQASRPPIHEPRAPIGFDPRRQRSAPAPMTPPPTRGYVEYEAQQSDPRSAKYDPLRPTDENAYQPKPTYGQKRPNERPRSPGHVAPPKRATPIDEDYRISSNRSEVRNELDPRARTQSNLYDQSKRDEVMPSTIDKYLKSSMSKDDILAKLKQDLFQKDQPKHDDIPDPHREVPRVDAPPPRLFGGDRKPEPPLSHPPVPNSYDSSPATPQIDLPAHLPPEIAEAVKTAQQYGPSGGYGNHQTQGHDYPPRGGYGGSGYAPRHGPPVGYGPPGGYRPPNHHQSPPYRGAHRGGYQNGGYGRGGGAYRGGGGRGRY